jgi:hypothetical protein
MRSTACRSGALVVRLISPAMPHMSEKQAASRLDWHDPAYLGQTFLGQDGRPAERGQTTLQSSEVGGQPR